MAYQQLNGVANPHTLIDLICTFLSAAGWTIDRNNLSSTNRTATIRAPGGSDYIHLYNTNQTEIWLRMSIGYNAANTPETQPNSCESTCVTNCGNGVYTNVYLHADGTEFHCVIEMAAATNFRHLVFGVAQKVGSFTGGTYIDGSWRGTSYLGTYPGAGTHNLPFGETDRNYTAANQAPFPGVIRADSASEGWTNKFHIIGAFYSQDITNVSRGAIKTTWTLQPQDYETNLWYEVFGSDNNIFSGRSIFYTPKLFVKRSGGTFYFSPLATINMTRFCNMRKFTNAQEIVIGTDTWKVYPAFRYTTTINLNNNSADFGSYTMGYAVKKVV